MTKYSVSFHSLLLAIAGLFLFVGNTGLRAQNTEADLLFALRTAVFTRNEPAVLTCFNLEGADEDQVQAIQRVIRQVCSWRNPHVFTTKREGNEPMKSKKDGRALKLNGDWISQVHLHRAPLPSSGFVFPVGKKPDGQYRILLTVDKKL